MSIYFIACCRSRTWRALWR